MPDDAEMRFRLQQVAAYRELCRSIRGSGRGNVFFALLMLFIAYAGWQAGQQWWVLAVYAGLAFAELAVGLFKWVLPSAEGILLDALILLLFAVFNLGSQYLRHQKGLPASPIALFFGVYLLMGAVSRFKSYGVLRQQFARRPTAEQMAWVDDLSHEIRTADPQSDELALDLPTRPPMRAKLLGSTAFFVGTRSKDLWVAGPDDFDLRRERSDHGTGRRKAVVRIHDTPYPEFELDDASWQNYQKWRSAQHGPQPG